MTLKFVNLKLENANQCNAKYIMPVIYAQYRLCEYQEQLILPSLASMFNIFILKLYINIFIEMR